MIFTSRKIFITLILLINLCFCVYLAINNPRNGLPSILLNIFVGNLLCYTFYYIIMKYYCGEKLDWKCWIFFVLLVLCLTPAMYFFQAKEKSTQVSAAESRSMNSECILFGFFDKHDIWHFLGGYALFFMFSFFLTLDDDILDVPRDEIPVF